MNSLVTGLARQGAEISPGDAGRGRARRPGRCWPRWRRRSRSGRGARGTCTRTRRRGGCSPRATGTARRNGGYGCSSGPDTVCFVMDPTRSGAVLARHAGIDEETGQLTADEDGGPRQLVISSDFYAVYQSAGKKADGLVNLYCWAHIRTVLRPGRGREPCPAEVLDARVAGPDPGPVRRARRSSWPPGRRPPRPRRGKTAPPRPAGEGIRRLGRRARRDRRGPQEAGDRPPACRNPRRRRSPPWTANGTG